jgi:pyruvate,water dikinase
MFTVDLDSGRKALQSMLGGKAANLIELAGIDGVKVPRGYCITTDAFRSFTRDLGLTDWMCDIGLVSEFSHKAQNAIKDKEMPFRMAHDICMALYGLRPPFAVRSSASHEDSKDHSFAGQQDSYLNVQPKDLIPAIKDCWASLYNAHALHYRRHSDIGSIGGIAVIVQEMVDAHSAGVIMTQDPVEGDKDTMVIDASWGLGCSVVSGEVNPDSYNIRKRDGAIAYRSIANKRLMTVGKDGHNVEVSLVGRPIADAPVLEEKDLGRLYKIAMDIERHFGCAQDIEFSIDLRDIYIVQARPLLMPGEGPNGKT